jgi:hypothetical protein
MMGGKRPGRSYHVFSLPAVAELTSLDGEE